MSKKITAKEAHQLAIDVYTRAEAGLKADRESECEKTMSHHEHATLLDALHDWGMWSKEILALVPNQYEDKYIWEVANITIAATDYDDQVLGSGLTIDSAIRNAVAHCDLDITPCNQCQAPVVTVSEGGALCRACAEKMESEQ